MSIRLVNNRSIKIDHCIYQQLQYSNSLILSQFHNSVSFFDSCLSDISLLYTSCNDIQFSSFSSESTVNTIEDLQSVATATESYLSTNSLQVFNSVNSEYATRGNISCHQEKLNRLQKESSTQ